MGEAKRRRHFIGPMTCAETASLMEARGYTSPDKHDLIIVALGDRVRVAEVGAEDGLVKGVSGETTMERAKLMLSTLPVDHNLGVVSVVLGTNFDCDEFPTFVGQQAKVKGFTFTTMHGPRSAKQVFDGLFESLGDVPTRVEC
jgi:hypothetical protein